MPPKESRVRDLQHRINEHQQTADGQPQPGVLTPRQQAVIDEGGHLPENMPLHLYPAQDAQTQGRNVHHPEVPMKPFGGTFTFSTAGKPTSRAPNMPSPGDPRPVAWDPEYWQKMADEVGIDHSQYHPVHDAPLLQAHVRQKLEEDARRADAGWDNVSVGNGTDARMWKPNPRRMAEHKEERELLMTPERKNKFAQEIIDRHDLTGADAADVRDMAATDAGFAELRRHNDAMNSDRRQGIDKNIKKRWADINFTRDFNNPAHAPGMYARQLREDVATGNFAGQSATHSMFGNHDAAENAMTQAGNAAQRQAAADEQARLLEAAKPKPALAEMQNAMKDILTEGEIPDGQQMQAAVIAMATLPQFANDPEGAARAADAWVRDHIARLPNGAGRHDPRVTTHLQQLAKLGKGPFLDYAIRVMNMPPALALQTWEKQRSWFQYGTGQ